MNGLAPGPYTLEFKNVAGWNRPANQFITLTADQTTQKTGTYVAAAPNQGAIEGLVVSVDAQGKALALLSGVAVNVSGHGTVATDASGKFSFAAVNAGTYTITAGKTGYYSATQTVSLAGGETKKEVFRLTREAATSQPVAISFSSPNGKHFIPGMPGTIGFETTIDWKGTPGTVRFFAAGEWRTATLTDLGGGQARATLVLPSPESISSSSELLLEVINGAGVKTMRNMAVFFHELPDLISNWFPGQINWFGSGVTVSHSISMEKNLWDLSYNGSYESSGDIGYEGSVSFNKDSGAFSGSLGASGVFTHKLLVQDVENIGEGSLGLTGNLKINLTDDKTLPTITPGWGLSAGGKAGVGCPVVRLAPIVFPPAAPAVDFLLGVPVVKGVLKALRARFFLFGALEADGEYHGGVSSDCFLGAGDIVLSGTLGIELEAALEKWGAKVGVYAGGSGTPEIQACPEWDFLGVALNAYVGFFGEAWLFDYDREFGTEIRLFSDNGRPNR